MQERYSRQMLFQPIAETGQHRLQQSKVAIIGCGALGTAVVETLVRAGVGTIYLADRDYVESSNLQRQQLFTTSDANEQLPKVVAAKKRLLEIDPKCTVYTYLQHVDAQLAAYFAERVDVLIDATDNFETRLLINDISYQTGIPWVHGACVGSSGVVFPFRPGETACFRCLLPVLPSLNETCDTAGIIAPAVQVTAALQSAEVLKFLTGNVDALRQKVHHFDVWHNTTMDIGVQKIRNLHCDSCSEKATYPALQVNAEQKYAVLCGRDAVQVLPGKNRVITLDDAEKAAKRIDGFMNRTPYFVQLQKDAYRMLVFGDGRLLIHGLKDIDVGRKIFVELFG